MHESTVSRVTSNKYLSCARGLFELKYFFTSAIQSADGGDAVSARSGQERDPRADRGRGREGPVRRHAGRPAQRQGLRHRAAHGREISRGAGDRQLGPAPPGQGAGAGLGRQSAIAQLRRRRDTEWLADYERSLAALQPVAPQPSGVTSRELASVRAAHRRFQPLRRRALCACDQSQVERAEVAVPAQSEQVEVRYACGSTVASSG